MSLPTLDAICFLIMLKKICSSFYARGPLQYTYDHNGTHDVVYELKGAPCVYSDSNGDDFGK